MQSPRILTTWATDQKRENITNNNLNNDINRKKKPMNAIIKTVSAAVFVALGLTLAAGAAEPPKPEPQKGNDAAGAADVVTTRPVGAYAQVHLDFMPPAGKRVPELLAWTYRGALRDSVMLMDCYAAITQPGGELRLRDGRFTWRIWMFLTEFSRLYQEPRRAPKDPIQHLPTFIVQK